MKGRAWWRAQQISTLPPIDPRISALGAATSARSFVPTISCLFTTPGVAMESYGLGPPGPFLIKDVVLFAASVWLVGQSLLEARARSR